MPPSNGELTHDGSLTPYNRFTGWTCMAAGVGIGLLLGLWSFDGPLAVPDWIGEYTATSRRMIRLGHIALMALGFINVLVGRELPHLALGAGARRVASVTMNIGNVFLPLTLFAGALWPPLKYLMPVPALCVLCAVSLMAYGARQRPALPSDEW